MRWLLTCAILALLWLTAGGFGQQNPGEESLNLEPQDAVRLEERVRANPYDSQTRLLLLAYYSRADLHERPEARASKLRHVLWLIEHQPDSEALASPYAALSDRAAAGPWEGALRREPSNAAVAWNAALYFDRIDKARSFILFRRAVALQPGNPEHGRRLGIAYGEAIVRGDRGVVAEVESLTDAAVLAPVVHMVQSHYNRGRMMGREQPELRDLALRLFRRLETLDPKVDREWVLPQLDPKMVGMLTRPAPVAARPAPAVRRLGIDAFPQLPAAAAQLLRGRKCTVPQPAFGRTPANVIRGEFFEKGQSGWAVLCSVGATSTILVFRHDGDTSPEELAPGEDQQTADESGYQRAIAAIGGKDIVRYYRAYGGPTPPPIDHHGIDDAFIGKASVVRYWYRGKWLTLTGAD